ncbi:MAG: trigger factor [Gemmatimonadaceae bacterium]
MNIQIETKKTEGAERLLEVSVPADEVKAATEKTARRYASKVRVPGFRAGKAPPQMVLKRFADAIRQETIESIVQEAYRKVIERENLKVAAQPHIHDLKFTEGEPLTFNLHVEVRPEVALARLAGFRVTRTERPVTEAHVREQIDQMREQRATWTPVDERSKEGDLVTVQLSTTDDNGEMSEPKEYKIVLGAGTAIPGIEELITETQPGDTAERAVRWPDDFPDESQRGKVKQVRLTLTDVKRKILPELDDAFAREVGDFESLAALQEAVRTDLRASATRETEAEVRQKLLDEVIGANPFDVPRSWVGQVVQAYAEMYRIPNEEKERFASQFLPAAERQVRRDLVVETIAERETLAAVEKDIDDRIAEMAAKRSIDPGKLYAQLQKAGRIKELERSITEDKVFKWLFEKNTVE